MYAIYAFGIIVLLAFLGSLPFFNRKRAFSIFNFFYYSGIVYIFLGLYLGENGTNVFNHKVLNGFLPLLSLGLGWIGFLFGFQLEIKCLRRFPRRNIALSLLQFAAVFSVVAFPMLKILQRFFPETETFLVQGFAVALGLLAGISSPTLLNAVSSIFSSRGHYYYLARFLVSIGAFWGIAGLAILHSFWHYPFFSRYKLAKGLVFWLTSILVPVVLGYFFHLLTKKKIPDQDLLVYLLGFVFFLSGTGFYFNLLPLFLCMVFGITYSNLTKNHERIYPIILAAEKPLYVLLLILIGAMWELNLSKMNLTLVGLLLILRLSGNMLPLPLFSRILRFPFPLPPIFGFNFMSAGGIGIALAVSIKLAYPVPLTDVFLTVALLTIIIGEVFSPPLLKKALYRLDESS